MVVSLLAFMKKKFKIIIMLILISCVTFGAYQYFQRSSSFFLTETTNLSEENINGLQLYDDIGSKGFIEKYGTNIERIDNALFDYYNLSSGLVIATDKQKKIIRITTGFNQTNTTLKTSKGINIESSVDDVIRAYGENYYKRMDDSGVPVIGYVDHKRKTTLEFFNYQSKVTMIRYDISSMQ